MNGPMSTKFLRPRINVVHQTGYVFIQEGTLIAEIVNCYIKSSFSYTLK